MTSRRPIGAISAQYNRSTDRTRGNPEPIRDRKPHQGLRCNGLTPGRHDERARVDEKADGNDVDEQRRVEAEQRKQDSACGEQADGTDGGHEGIDVENAARRHHHVTPLNRVM